MLEARLAQASVLKRTLDAIKDLVSDANLDCDDNGLKLQSMDQAHVALVALALRSNAFEPYRCDRNINLGMSLGSLSKIIKCAGNDDVVTLKAEDNKDKIHIMLEAPNNDRLSEYSLKLMDIDAEHYGIPETEYDATVRMSSVEFQRICRDLLVLSESMTIETTKEGVRFSADGDIGAGSVTLKQGGSVDAENKETATQVELNEPVTLTFSLKYLANFTKATPLSDVVYLSMSSDQPLLVEYRIEDIGYIRYYLAPKIGDAN